MAFDPEAVLAEANRKFPRPVHRGEVSRTPGGLKVVACSCGYKTRPGSHAGNAFGLHRAAAERRWNKKVNAEIDRLVEEGL